MKKRTFGEFVVSSRIVGVLLAVLIMTATVLGFKFFSYDAAAESNFDRHSQIFLEHEKLNTVFNSADTIIIYVDFKDTVFTKDNYGLIGDITRSAALIPGVSRVSSLSNIAIPSTGNDGEMVVGYLDSRYNLAGGEGVEAMRKYVLGSNLTNGVMVSRDGKGAAIYASIGFPEGADVPAIQKGIYGGLGALRETYRDICRGRCSVEFNGKLVEEIEMTKVATNALPLAIVIQNATLFFALWILTSSIRAAFFVCVLSTIGTTVSIGVVSLMGYGFNSFSVASGPIICAILFSQTIHLVWHYLKNLAEGVVARTAMVDALNAIVIPTVATTAVTLVAYFSIATSQSPAMFTYGLSLAAGGVAGLLFILFLLPHFLITIKSKPRYLITDFIGFRYLGEIVSRKYIALFFSFSIPMILLSVFAFKNAISEFPRGMLVESNNYRVVADKIDAAFGGSSSVSYIIRSKNPATVETAEMLAGVTAFTDWCREQPGVSGVSSISDVLLEINKALSDNGDNEKKMTTDDVADAFFLYRLALPYGADTSETVSHDKKMIKIRISFSDSHTHVLMGFVESANIKLKALGLDGSPAGLSYIFSSFMLDFAKQEIYSFIGLIFAVLCFMSVYYRSLSLGAIIAIPVAVPVAAGLGISYLYSGYINFSVCGVMGITVGLVVDETMHIVTGFFDRLKKDGSAEAAGAGIISSVGPGVCISCFVLCCGFASISFGEWANYGVIARLASIILALSVFFQFFVLVPALIIFNRNK